MTQLYQEEPISLNESIDLMQYKQKQKFKFVCTVCNQETIKYRVNISYPLICGKCNRKKVFENYDWNDRNLKSEKTKLEKYGDAHYTNGEKIKKTFALKTDEEKQRIKEKVFLTNMEKYGSHPAQRQEQKEKTKQTCLKKYGVSTPFKNEDVKQKYIKTCQNKYGVNNVFQLDTVKEKIKDTNILKYGVLNPRLSKEIDDKIKSTNLERYGCEHVWSNHDIRIKCQQSYKYHDIFFDSSWELCLFIYLTDKKIDFEYQPNIYFEYLTKRYYPDFKINGELYEIKGEQFFDGDKMINPYDRTMDYIYEEKHQCMILNDVKILRKNDLKNVFEYIENTYTMDFIKLFKTDLSFPYINEDLKDISDYGLIHHFHKSIFKANKKGFKSPFEAWNDKNLIEKSAINRLKFVKKCKPLDVLYGFSVAKFAPKVSVFNPKLATNLINKYLSDSEVIVDPFSGFSGRLLGCLNNNKKYIGYDLSEEHVNESNKIIEYKKAQDMASVEQKNIFDISNMKCDSLFTCPPYSDKENWENEKITQSCDDWIDLCLEKFDCKIYLFVVDETIKYNNYIVDEIVNKNHLSFSKEYIIMIKNVK